MPFTPVDAFGTVGLILLLSGFVTNAFGKLSAETALYQWLNFLGSGILAVYAYVLQSWVFLPLEIVWAAVAAVALVRIWRGGSARGVHVKD